jgi:glutathione S-transferase
MAAAYRIFGSELSPYSVKVRSYFRWKGLPHEWILRGMSNMEEYRRFAKLPLIPLVVTPEGEGLQDSTPIIEEMERRHPTPPLAPSDPTLAFVAALLEEYGDEWGNKPMFHYRWTYEPDQISAAERIARDNAPDLDAGALAAVAAQIRERMVPRLGFVGSSPATLPTIEQSFRRQCDLLEAHLAARSYVLGARPSLADLGLACQLYQCWTDPTPGALLRARHPRVVAWIQRMLAPATEGDFEPWARLAPTLTPLLRDEVAGLFLPWSAANARAIAAGEKTFTLPLEGRPFSQETQKYHAKSLATLRAKWAAARGHAPLATLMHDTGCARWLDA